MGLSKEQILTLTCLKEVGVKGVGPKKIFAIGNLIEDKNVAVETLEDLANLMSSMKEKQINSVSLQDLQDASRVAKSIIDASEADGIGLVGYYDEDFPNLLRSTINEEGKLEPPLLLWYKGNLSVVKLPCIAVIGTREPTIQGAIGGEWLASEFAKRGFNIVSGLAVGCDTCGHQGALKVNGLTTAILANGLDYASIYPPENQRLAESIVKEGGLLLSEYHIGSAVNRYNLVARDRLQSGLSLATLVIQTGVNGGTMHAARATLQANKPLYAMLFKDDATNEHEKCRGNAYLVKQGAKFIKGSDNLDEICDKIKGTTQFKADLFSL